MSSWGTPAMSAKRMRSGWLAIVAIVALSGSMPVTVRAQWGGGFGYGGLGWGFGMFTQVPSPQTYLNQKSLVDAGRGSTAPTSTPYAGNANAYFNRVRDNGFVPRFDVERRQPANYRYGQTGGARSPARGEGRVADRGSEVVPRRVQPLENFYTPDHRLVWPGDAPEGNLKDKRSAADSAVGIVFAEARGSGVASLASVTDARQKLIDYGRPALDEIRTRDSTAVAESFHTFLLSLYDSLALAATPGLAAAR